MRTLAFSVLAAALVSIGGGDAAQAGTWRVGRAQTDCPAGCNFHDGSTGSGPGLGLLRAMVDFAVLPGDTVLIYPRPGVPQEQACEDSNRFLINRAIDLKSGVVVKAAIVPLSVCIAGATNGEAGVRFLNTSEATVLDGIRFRWDSNFTGFGGAISCFAASGVIRNCVFDGCQAGVGAAIYQFISDVRIENNLIMNSISLVGGGAIALASSNPVIQGNTFYHNTAPFGSQGVALYMSDAAPTFTKNLIVESLGGTAVYCAGENPGSITCNMFWDNPLGVFGGSCADLTDTLDNVNANPGFCNVTSLDFNLCVYSPALTGPCGALGYVPPTGGTCSNCPTAVGIQLESASWGRIKSLYR